ncbi:MAG TPA: M20/M25/M40 family metallo-hydrolase [Armatimonadetes bacterium]|jgi:tripeptide aminopeptidase|nr:M20/M25/M40 family metallo-hydrolase [Armatimonadota bacterium]
MIDQWRVRETFLRLLRMNTPSGQEGPVADFLEAELRALGFETWRDGAGKAIGGETGNLLARRPGSAPEAPTVLLNAHMDTVAPTEALEIVEEPDGVIRSSGTTILGADDKAGLTAILEGVRAAVAEGFPMPTVEIAFTIAEETGLRGARHLDYSSLTATQGYAFDGGKPVGGIVVAAPSQDNVTAVVHGVAAHAGAAPEKGVSAIRIAAEAISRMPLGRIDAETTANIGVIQGGHATNIVPDRVECRGEARSHDDEKLTRQTRAMTDAFNEAAAAAGGRAEVRVERVYSHFGFTENDPLVRRAVSAASRAGIAEVVTRPGGGGSDANIFNTHGIATVVVGLGYDNVHANNEYMSLADLTTAARVALEILRLAGAERA